MPPVDPTSRPRNAEATRLDLLRVARRRFTVLGYERTTTRDIAADAGVNVALISRYFGSKEGLFAAVIEDSAELMEPWQPGSIDDLAVALADSLRPDAWPEFDHVNPMVLLLRDIDDDRVGALRRQALSSAIDAFAGLIGGDDTARLRADLVFALLAGVFQLRGVLPDEPLATAEPDVLAREIIGVVQHLTG
ncbi:TetR/AcrR family transcriptional regulator [Nocardioides hankookensis]|uniref:TetR/AcrR family transcriptional regulator n=1 Tax=Nocardioides hankookensis TaxID=443157 RepID=A0ABW1LME1_9ACTN